MGIDKNRGRRTTASDLFQNPAIRHLRKTAPAVFGRRCHAEDADAPESVNYLARNICLPIYLRRIEFLVEKVAKFGERCVQFRLLCCRDQRIGYHPIGHKTAEKKAFCKTKRLRPREEQLLRLSDFLLTL